MYSGIWCLINVHVEMKLFTSWQLGSKLKRERSQEHLPGHDPCDLSPSMSHLFKVPLPLNSKRLRRNLRHVAPEGHLTPAFPSSRSQPPTTPHSTVAPHS